MSTQKQFLLLSASAILMAACASGGVQVSSTWDPLAPFPKQATYAWDDAASKLPPDASLQSLGLPTALKQAADKAFAARGYRVTTGSADYRLSYQLTVHNWIGPDESTSIGSLSLQMVKAATGHRVWTGFARAEVHVGATQEAREKRLRKLMNDMVKKFPPNQG